MTKGTTIPSAASPPDAFAGALSAFNQAKETFVAAREALDLAQVEHTAAVNALPVPAIMQGPEPVITPRSTLAAAEQKLRASIVGPHAEAEITGHLREIAAYQARLAEIGQRLNLGDLGAAAFETMCAADQALEALLAVPAGTMADLFEKLHALRYAGWETVAGDKPLYLDRLLADAGGLTLQFAHVWLERWTSRGGSLTLDLKETERVLLGREFDGDERREGHMDGLEELLRAMPGGIEAVKAAVGVNPELGLAKTVTA